MSARDIKKLKTDSKRLENSEAELPEIVVPAEPEPAAAESAPAVPEPVPVEPAINQSHEIDELQQALDIALDDVSSLTVKYDSKCRELNDIISARDKALQDIEEVKQQVKKLKAENKKLKAEIMTLKTAKGD